MAGRSKLRGEVNVAELDAHYDPHGEEEGDNALTKELKKRIKRLEPDGDFVPIQLGDDPLKVVRIGADLPEDVKEKLTQRLREHTDLFAWSAADIPGIPPVVACHHLAIDPQVNWVAQRWRVQKEDKAKAAIKAVEDLIAAGFVKEVQRKFAHVRRLYRP